MFILKTLHLQNFGAISDSMFAPVEDGVTSIYGANGNGKSTFLDALIWVLFGAAPKDKKQADIRNFSADDKDKTVVEVVFEHEGDLITVTRSMNKRGTVTAQVSLNGQEPMTKTTPSTAVAWVKRRLGISEESFTQAFAIRQKELDDLVSATASKRREIIERIFGVDKLSLALKYAKEDEKESRIAFEQYRDVSEDLTALDEEIESLTAEFTATENSLEELSVEADDLEEQKQEALKTWNALSDDERTHRNAQKLIEDKKQEIERTELSVSYAEKSLAEIDVDENMDVDTEYAELTQKQQEMRSKRDSLTQTMDSYTRERAQLESKKNSLLEDIQNKEARKDFLTTDLGKIETFLSQEAPHSDDELLSQVKIVDAERESLLSICSVLENTVTTMTESLSALSGHDASCPTCHQDLENPSELVKSFESQKKNAQEQLQQNQDKVKKAQEQRSELEDKKRALDTFMQSQQRAEEQKGIHEAELSQIETQLKENAETVSSLEDQLKQDKNADLRTQQESLTTEYESVLKRLNNLESVKQAQAKIRSLHVEISEGKEKVKSITEELTNFEGEMPALVPSEDVEKAQQKYSEVNAAYEKSRNVEKVAQQSYYTQRSALDLKHSDKAGLVEESESRDRARKVYEQKVATSRFISDFRKETISRIAPEISASASAVVSSMTSDEFVSINIDEEFTPSVMRADGREDPISFLSGGEKSLVALSMFLGIRDILSGGVGGFMWADEALVSQDANRRNLIASTLRNLPHAQLVMVNHTPDGNDLSDMAIELVKGEKGSSLKYD